MSKKEEENPVEQPVEDFSNFSLNDIAYKTHLTAKFLRRKPYESRDPKKVTAFIPGKIKKVFVKKGSKVKEGDKLMILEAMKMNNNIFSPMRGTVKEVYVTPGLSVAKETLLVEFR